MAGPTRQRPVLPDGWGVPIGAVAGAGLGLVLGILLGQIALGLAFGAAVGVVAGALATAAQDTEAGPRRALIASAIALCAGGAAVILLVWLA